MIEALKEEFNRPNFLVCLYFSFEDRVRATLNIGVILSIQINSRNSDNLLSLYSEFRAIVVEETTLPRNISTGRNSQNLILKSDRDPPNIFSICRVNTKFVVPFRSLARNMKKKRQKTVVSIQSVKKSPCRKLVVITTTQDRV